MSNIITDKDIEKIIYWKRLYNGGKADEDPIPFKLLKEASLEELRFLGLPLIAMFSRAHHDVIFSDFNDNRPLSNEIWGVPFPPEQVALVREEINDLAKRIGIPTNSFNFKISQLLVKIVPRDMYRNGSMKEVVEFIKKQDYNTWIIEK